MIATDPCNTISKAYQIDSLTPEDARLLFMSWVLSLEDDNVPEHARKLLNIYAKTHPDHPMTDLLEKAL